MSLPTGVKITDIDFELRAADDQVAMVWNNYIRVKRARCRLSIIIKSSNTLLAATWL